MAYRIAGPLTISLASDGDLGQALDGAIIRIQTFWKAIQTDSFGETPVDQIFLGKNLSITFIAVPIALELASIWVEELGSIGAAADDPPAIGALATTLGQKLTITERNGDTWVTENSVLSDPEQLLLSSKQEMQIPITVICTPNLTTGKFFTSVPAYII